MSRAAVVSSLSHTEPRRVSAGSGWPFVGREEQLQVILEAATQAASGGVVLAGSPGVGKTRLAHETCSRLSARGYPITWVTATQSAAAIPFGALILSTVDHERTAGNTSSPLARASRIGAVSAGLAVAGNTAEVVETVVARLLIRAGRRPVLAVDDAHLLDGASAALVHRLATHHKVFAVLVLTSGARAPDALRSLWKERHVHRVDVPALPHDAIDILLRETLGGPLDGVSNHWLQRLCAGNLLVLRELLAAIQTTDALRQVAGIWRRSADRSVARRLCDAITDHLDIREPRLRAVVEVVACAEPLAQMIAEAATDRDSLAEAEQRGLIVVEPSGARIQVRMSVPAYGMLIRARLSALSRRGIWYRLAELHAQLPHRRVDDVLTEALWRIRASLPVPSEDLLAAARVALAAMDFPTTQELLAAARAAGGGWHAELALAEIQHLQGHHADALKALPDGVDDTDPRLVVIRETAAYWTAGVRPDGSADADRGDETVLAARTWPTLLDGKVEAAVGYSEALLQRARQAKTVVSAASSTIAAAGLLGDYALVERAYNAGLAASQGAGSPFGLARLAAARCLATLLAGSPQAAAVQAEAGYAAAIDAEIEPLAGLWAALRGVVAKASGRIRMARQALHEAVALLSEQDAPGLTAAVLAELAGAYGMAGDAVRAENWLAEAQRCGRPVPPLFDAWIERNRAWVTSTTGDLPRAAACALRAAEIAESTRQTTVAAAALFDAARLGAPVEARDRLRDISTRLSVMGGACRDGIAGPTPAFAAAIAALAAQDPRALTLAADTLHGLGFLLPAAELAATAYRLQSLAGRHAAGQQALTRARELLRDCADADTPLMDLGHVRTVLTEREHHVARLAAEGLTGRAIASRLGLSLRTVNNHLSRAYAKLGISGRAGLATVLAAQEQTP